MSSFLYDVSLDTQQWEDDSQVEKEMIIIVSSQRRADKREGCKKSEKKGHRIKFRRRDMPEKRKMLETSHKRAPPCSLKKRNFIWHRCALHRCVVFKSLTFTKDDGYKSGIQPILLGGRSLNEQRLE